MRVYLVIKNISSANGVIFQVALHDLSASIVVFITRYSWFDYLVYFGDPDHARTSRSGDGCARYAASA
jgi:hypothetical protein